MEKQTLQAPGTRRSASHDERDIMARRATAAQGRVLTPVAAMAAMASDAGGPACSSQGACGQCRVAGQASITTAAMVTRKQVADMRPRWHSGPEEANALLDAE